MEDSDQERLSKVRTAANDLYDIIESDLRHFAGLHINGILNKMEIGRVKAEMVSRLNSFQVVSIAQDRMKRDDEIKQFLLDMGAQVEELKDSFLISLQGTQEKEAPTIKDAFFLWVTEMVMSREGTPLQKQREQQKKFKLQRNLKFRYQFPAAVWFEHAAENNISAWVVNVVGNKPLYGVVRYFVGGDRAAWVESESFGKDATRAREWCQEMMRQLAEEMKQ